MDDEKPPLYEVDFETGKTRIVPEPTPDARLRAALEPFAKLAKEIENLGANMVLADTDGLSIVLGMTPTLDEPVLGDLREAAAALEAAPEAWRAIETAPQKRKVLVAYKNRAGHWRIVLAFHGCPPLHPDADPYEGCIEIGDEWICPLGWWEEAEAYEDEPLQMVDGEPTHWRPLPQPPSSTREGS